MEVSKTDWAWCGMCGPMIICPKCGNNTCNASYGHLPSKTPWGEPGDVVCDLCPGAYDYDHAHRDEARRVFRCRLLTWRFQNWFGLRLSNFRTRVFGYEGRVWDPFKKRTFLQRVFFDRLYRLWYLRKW